MTPFRAQIKKRNDEIIALYQSGVRKSEIAERMGLLPGSIRYVLVTNNIPRVQPSGPLRKSPAKLKHPHREKRYRAEFGLSYDEVLAIPPELVKAYRIHRRNALLRNVPFRLTLTEWLDIWNGSGKLDQRGTGAEQYCMSRVGDQGGYEVGNVFIQKNADNIREVGARLGRGTKGATLRRPGSAKPYQAAYRGSVLGFFASEDEAQDAYQLAVLADKGLHWFTTKLDRQSIHPRVR